MVEGLASLATPRRNCIVPSATENPSRLGVKRDHCPGFSAGHGEGAQFASLALTALAGAPLPGRRVRGTWTWLDRLTFDLAPGYATHAVAQMGRAVAQRGLDREPVEARAEQ